jgi:hypothetical protein
MDHSICKKIERATGQTLAQLIRFWSQHCFGQSGGILAALLRAGVSKSKASRPPRADLSGAGGSAGGAPEAGPAGSGFRKATKYFTLGTAMPRVNVLISFGC